MMVDTNFREVPAGKASPTVKPALSSEPARYLFQSSPPNSKCPSGLRQSAGPAPTAASSIASTTNLWSFPKSSSFSSTASKFKPFSKHRTRRLSDDSLTDLSPPTHSDLDCISPYRNAPSDHLLEHQEPPSPSRSHRTSAIFLGNFKPSSLSHKPPKDNTSSGNMNLFKGPGSQASFSSRLRLLSKNSSEKQAAEKNKTSSTKNQIENSSSRSLRSAGLKPFQHKSSKSELEFGSPTDSEAIEAIKSPSCDIRIVANPSYPPRSCSIVRFLPGVEYESSDGSSSSSNLMFPNTFSQRPSSELARHNASVNVMASPKRSHAPPPIKVPKMRANSVAIALGSDSSPRGTYSGMTIRHAYSRSDGGDHLISNITTLEWPGHGTKSSKQSPLEGQTVPEALCIDAFGVLPDSPSHPRDGVISISNSSKALQYKVPTALPLQPAPRRVSGHAYNRRCDSKGPTMPLLIAKHSRGLSNTACVEFPSTSSESVSRATPPSLVGHKGAPTPSQLPQYPQTPQQSSAGSKPNLSWSRLQESTEVPAIAHGVHNFSPGFIPFPTSEWPSQQTSPHSEDDVANSPSNDKGDDHQSQLEPFPVSQTKGGKLSPGKKNPRTKSFDIRNFPLHLDTSPRSDSLPSIAIPQPIQISQFVSASLPPLPTCAAGQNAEPSLRLSAAAVRPYESSDLSSLGSIVSNVSSAEAHGSMNSIFTPASTSPSDRSSGGSSFAEPSQKPYTPTYHSTLDRNSRSISVDDFYLDINSDALLDLSRRYGKKLPRPRSMSDRGPNRYEIATQLFGYSKGALYSSRNAPYPADHSLPLFTVAQSPQSTRWITTSISQKIRESTNSELDKLVSEALKTHHPDSHRFVAGNIKELIREGRESEQKVEELHRRYLAEMHAREKLLQRLVMTSRALNGDKGAHAGESVLKSVMYTDQLTSQLLGLIDHTSKIDRMCEAHWRAAATVQMNNLAIKEAQLEAAQSRIEQLVSDRARHQKQISDFQAKIDVIQDQARPSSRATDLESTGTGPPSSVRMNPKNMHEVCREKVAPDSPSSTPRMSHFPHPSPQYLTHTNLFKSRVRFNSGHSFCSSHSSHSPCDNTFGEGGGCCSVPIPEPVSPRTAFLSPYGLAHNQATSHERSESFSMTMSRSDLGSNSPLKTHVSNASLSALSNVVTSFNRSDSIKSRKKVQVAGLIPRNILTTNNTIKHKGSLNGTHFKSTRSSSLTSSDLKIEGLDTNVSGSQDSKPRSSSNTFLPYLKGATNVSPTEASPVDGSNDFQPTSSTSRGPSSSSLTRFPRQAAPAPKLPLPYESNARRRGQWSPSSPSHGNLSSITLSQLGSIDIANLLSDMETCQ
ncbi:hypothetical protein VP01_166g12 [Puccinia sorghi]|uniref:Uncharacterized protein n=1 Tax=Puccinia sorghi TaxID=27349 RepID=A0A0L6VHZ8_9BASI|nr:hypothetical protein VP01_166g12 [Puccinia sorghi]